MEQPTHYDVRIDPDGLLLEAVPPILLTDLLAEAGILINAPCGGNGTCGKCKVILQGQVPPLTTLERQLLSPEEQDRGMRLACQIRVTGDLAVTIPESSRTTEMRVMLGGTNRPVQYDPLVVKQYAELPVQSLDHAVSEVTNIRETLDLRADLHLDLPTARELALQLRESERRVTLVIHDDRIVAVEPGDTTAALYGVALDIGTTTIVGALLDLTNGRELATASTVNEQSQYGHDVVSRILYTTQHDDGLATLQATVHRSARRVLTSLTERAGIDADQIYEVTVVGNTTMIHLFAGIDPRSLGTLPYVPVISDAVDVPASEFDLGLSPKANVHLLPNIAGFVGADTVGAILAAAFDEDDGRIRLLADIGTNCEIVLRKGSELLACSTPAGPTFEGARITHGMYAVPGAIERVVLDGDCKVRVIGRIEPKGICGSGLVDAGAELLRVGLVDAMGRLLGPDELNGDLPQSLRDRLIQDENGTAFVLAHDASGQPITLTQRDLRELQLAKGAIRTGIGALLEHAGISIEELDELCLAGGFGSYINKANAIRLGLIPAMPEDHITYLGNAAVVGAKLVLASREMRRRARQVAQETLHLQVAHTPEFQMAFADAMIFENAVV